MKHIDLSSRSYSLLAKIVLIVIALHLLLLGIGTLWNPAAPVSKQKAKVIVQTVRLQPRPPEAVRIQTPVTSVIPEPPSNPLPSAQLQNEKIALETKEAAQAQEHPQEKIEKLIDPPKPQAEPAPAPSISNHIPPPAIEIEKKPLTKALDQKSSIQKIPEAKKAPPPPAEKAPNAQKKTSPKESVKPKQSVDTQKKEQQALADKKRQQQEKAEAEKKRLQQKAEADKQREKEKAEAEKKREREKEKAEAEKKRQREKAEAEKKRQEAIAAAEEAARKKEQALLAKAKQTLAKMDETRDKITATSSINLEKTSLPKELGLLQVDAMPLAEGSSSPNWGAQEVSYSNEVAYRLKKGLKLPDYGAVKIKLTLDRTGKVIKVETIKTESAKNKAYVESKIPLLLFPSFGPKFEGVQQNTFVITLQNES